MNRKRWSRNYDCCLSCGTTSVRHTAHGLCKYCRERERMATEPEYANRVRQYKHGWYRQNVDQSDQAKVRNEKHFSGLRDAVLERDGHRCTRCGRDSMLVVHHVDGTGRGSRQHNNCADNLTTLCRACHARHHSLANRWSRGYDQCTECGRTDRKHNAHGLCVACYSSKAYHSVK